MKRLMPFFIILAISAFFRFWQLDRIPPSLSHDEVAIGYNAYSILKTGKDEYGTPWPLLFRSFDDYKLPGMIYLSVPSIAAFGLNEWGVRLPSAIAGTLTVLITYLLVIELFARSTKSQAPSTKQIPSTKVQNSKRFDRLSFVWNLGFGAWDLPKATAFTSALLLAISPWHINFSRQSFESNGALFFAMTGFLFLLRSRQKINYLITSLLFFALSLYFYYSVRLVIPFILAAYILIYKDHLRNHLKITLAALALFAVVSFPIIIAMFTSGGIMRLRIVNITNDPSYIVYRESLVRLAQTLPPPLGTIVFNRRLALPLAVVTNYWKNISPKHIFISGTSTYGLQHPFELPLMVIGLAVLLSLADPARWLVVIWLLSAVLPGAFSLNQPNSLRTLLNAPMFSLLSGVGLASFIEVIKKEKRVNFFFIPFAIFLIFTLSQFGNAYFVANADLNARAFGDGHKQMVTYVSQREKQFEKIIITGSYWRPYIYTLFWLKYDPAEYQKGGSPEGFNKYYFTAADWDKSGVSLLNKDIDLNNLAGTNPAKTLFILSPTEYNLRQEQLRLLDPISGTKTHNVFYAAILKQ